MNVIFVLLTLPYLPYLFCAVALQSGLMQMRPTEADTHASIQCTSTASTGRPTGPKMWQGHRQLLHAVICTLSASPFSFSSWPRSLSIEHITIITIRIIFGDIINCLPERFIIDIEKNERGEWNRLKANGNVDMEEEKRVWIDDGWAALCIFERVFAATVMVFFFCSIFQSCLCVIYRSRSRAMCFGNELQSMRKLCFFAFWAKMRRMQIMQIISASDD